MLKRLTATAIGLGLAGTVAFAASHVGPNDGAIKARKAHMTLYGHNIGVLGAMAQGKMDYDAEAASIAAANLNALVNLNQAGYWPQGSDNSANDNTRALPDLWANFPDVMTKATALVDASAAMNDAAGNGLEALQGAMGALGGACGACHKAYRAPE